MIDGVLNIYKESGMTSQQVVTRVKKMTGCAKAGHAGTLDPLAEGVLPVLLGKATKMYDAICGGQKLYTTECVFGRATDTQDSSGVTIGEKTPNFTEDALKDALFSFVGGYAQLTPMYSARRVNGQKLYELARKGVETERKTVFAEIFGIKIIEINANFSVKFTVLCGKGVYIRAICDDLGRKLNCLAYMNTLRRDMCGGFFAENAVTLSQLDEICKNGKSGVLLPIGAEYYGN